MPLIDNDTNVLLNSLKENEIDALLTPFYVTTERFERFDYASGLPPIRLTALYHSRSTPIIFDALTAGIDWHIYLLFLLSIASFGVLYRLTENVLLPRKRVSFTRLCKNKKRVCSARVCGISYMRACYRRTCTISSIKAQKPNDVFIWHRLLQCSPRWHSIRVYCYVHSWYYIMKSISLLRSSF